jgi:predicted aspartyl protease
MALTFLKLHIINPAKPQRRGRFTFLIDSGAVFSVLPKESLVKLGIHPTSHEEFILANGEVIRNPVGNALFEFRGKIRAAPVVFGEKGVFLLGATTIEALGMCLDPIRRELKPLPMLLMRMDPGYAERPRQPTYSVPRSH